jgi:hypothetical protein
MREWFDRKITLDAWRPRYRQKVDALIRLYVEGEASPLVKLAESTSKAIESLGGRPVAAVSRAVSAVTVSGGAVIKISDGRAPSTFAATAPGYSGVGVGAADQRAAAARRGV